jgi:uncharacterized membrane protein YcaP (DUF421 family)
MNEDVIFFFGGWTPVLRILLLGTLMYISLVVILRVSGSRTLTKMNAFDFIVTVALGSAYGRALTARQVALVEALVAFALLVVLQYVVTLAQLRWPFVMGYVTTPPALLYYRGKFIDAALKRERVTEAEVLAALRKQGIASLGDVEAVILESSADFSVLPRISDTSTLGDKLREQVERERRTAG